MMSPALSKTLLLAVPSSIGLLALLVHGFTFRRRAVMWAFVVAGLLFGIARGNVIHWITVDEARLLSDGGFGMMPYIITSPVLRLFNASLQECIGWLFALYLGWCLSEGVLRRVGGGMERRLFAVTGLTGLFMVCICYAVEAGAGALHWWVWTLPLQSRLFLEVPPEGFWAWFSVAFDFLMPLLAVVAGRRALGRWRWALVLVFPLHMGVHIIDPWCGNHVDTWTRLFVYWHWLMLGAVLVLGMGCTVAVESDRDPADTRLTRIVRWFPLGVAIMLLGVLWIGMGPVAGRYELWLTTVPLVVFVLLAVERLPLAVPVAVALLAAPLAQWRGLAGLLPLAGHGAMGLARTHTGTLRLRAALAALVLLSLAAVGVVTHHQRQTLRDYVVTRITAARSRNDRDLEQARAALGRAYRWHPSQSGFHTMAAIQFAGFGDSPLVLEELGRTLEYEPEFVVARSTLGVTLASLGRPEEARPHLGAVTERLPNIAEARQNLGLALLMLGEPAAARDELLQAVALRPEFVKARRHLARAYADLGDHAEAKRLLHALLAAHPGDVAAHLDLGTLHLMANEPEQAARMFEKVLGLEAATIDQTRQASLRLRELRR